jgi:radical SAM protein with 4Fe4S-binding SPASM domain
VISTINALNLPELDGMLALLRSAGVRFWRVQPIIHSGRVRSHGELHIDRSMVYRIGSFVRAHRGDEVQVICSDGLEYVDELGPRERPWRGCSAGIATCGITSSGKVKGCLSLPDDVIEGDLRQRSLWDIWFDPQSFAYTRGPCELGPNCVGCEKGVDCKGGCSSSSYCATGQFHNDAFCFYQSELQAVSDGVSAFA